MTRPSVSRRAVAALFLARQWLDKPRGRKLTARTLGRFASATCGVQIDSVNVLDRAHHVTLWSRFGEYDRAALERLIYRRRVLFEYLSHVACFVPTDDLPIWRAFMDEVPERFRKRLHYPGTEQPLVDAVEQAIAERGPLGNADFERPKHMGKGGGWWTWKPATHALDYLWKAGRIGVHSRRHFHKRFATMSAVLAQAATVTPLPIEEARRQRVLRSLAAMGAAAQDDLHAYWTWPRWFAVDMRTVLAGLVREGLVSEVAVEGQRSPWFARTADLAALQSADRRRAPSTGTTLLAPFDSFLWHRDRALRLWGYHYRIEIYVPGHLRSHGYYSLPVLHDGQLVGRVDAKTHREAGVLEAKHVHLEPWLAKGEAPPRAHWGAVDRDAALVGIAGALRSLARHVGCGSVKLGRVTPVRLRAPVAGALRRDLSRA
jgi:uncharacterized protein YcaQ